MKVNEFIKVLQQFDEDLEVVGYSNVNYAKNIEVDDINVTKLKVENPKYNELIKESCSIGNRFIRTNIANEQAIQRFEDIQKELLNTPEYLFENVISIKTFGLTSEIR